MFDNVFSFYVVEPCWFMAEDIWQYALIALFACAVGTVLFRLSGRGGAGLGLIAVSFDLFFRKYTEEIWVNIILLIFGCILFAFSIVHRCSKKEIAPLGARCLKGIISSVATTFLIMPFIYFMRGLTMSAYGGANVTVIRIGGIIMIAGIIISTIFNLVQLKKPLKRPFLFLVFGNIVFLIGYFILTFTGIPSLWDRIFSFIIICVAAVLVAIDINSDIKCGADN